MLGEHVLAGDAELGRAVLHVGRHIGRAHDDQAHAAPRGREDELARASGVLLRQRADARKQGTGFLEDPSLGKRDADVAHGSSVPVS